MSDNRFADCSTADHVLHSYSYQSGVEVTEDVCADALARIRELAPPPTVSEEARERALSVVHADRWDRALSSRQLLNRVIDALGYTPEHPLLTMSCRCGEHHPPAPESPSFVDMTPAELREAATLVEGFAELHRRTFKITESDDLPPTWPVPIIYAQLPVRVVCGDFDWVLRIGGEQ